MLSLEQDQTASSQARSDLETLLKRMGAYFPFTFTGSKRDIQLEQTFQELNITFCELTSLLVLSPQEASQTQSLPPTFSHVASYVANLLDGTAPGSLPGIPQTLTSQAYTMLLPTIWVLAHISSGEVLEDGVNILEAALQHGIRVSSTSAAKRSTIEFVGRLVMLDTEGQYTGSVRIATGQALSQTISDLVQTWLLHLPKTLWELGNRDTATSECVLRLLLCLCQRRARCLTSNVGDHCHLIVDWC